METPSNVSKEWRRFLNRTCRTIMDDEWPIEHPLTFDGTSFEGIESDEAAIKFFETLRVWGKVRELRVSNLFLSRKAKDQLECVLEANPLLKKLELVNVSTDEEGMHFLTKSLFFSRAEIEEFTLDNCSLQRKDTIFLLRLIGVGSLSVLNLRNMDLDETIPRISSVIAFHSTIKELDLSGCRMSQSSLMDLFHGLARTTSLNSIRLQNCGIGSSVAKELDYLLTRNSSLETLDLSSNNIRGDLISLLVKSGLANNVTLQQLVLSQNPIGDNGAHSLVELLVSNPTIQQLSLVDCEIWGPGCRAIATGLARMKGLKSLFVDGDMEEYANEVLQSLESNMTLRYLWTDRSAYLFYKDRKWRLVEFFLRLNRGKRRMLVEPGVPISLWSIVLEGISGNPHLTYHILRQKPELMTYNA